MIKQKSSEMGVSKKEKRGLVITEIFMILLAAVWFIPIYYLIVTTFKNPQEATQSPLGLPKVWVFQNYVDAFVNMQYPRALFNSVKITVLAVAIIVLVTSMAGYALASTSDNAAAGTETKGSTANASSDEKLVVWTLSNDLIDFGKRFQEQTGVEVDTVVIEPADYPTKVQTALLAGEKEPDIIVGEPKMLEDFFDAGFFEDLNQAPYNAQDYADQIVDYVWQVGQYLLQQALEAGWCRSL